jgi:hypothetical protein
MRASGSGLLIPIPDCFPGLLREFLHQTGLTVLHQPEGLASGPQSLAGQQEASGGSIRERMFPAWRNNGMRVCKERYDFWYVDDNNGNLGQKNLSSSF